ncbi:HAD-like protein [Auricularia subglabra TFB-10046 SS5]|nr:HAD-like protein [Auricularia subglabra TFB-10046 SS5]
MKPQTFAEPSNYNALICDLGDVLLHWTAPTASPLPPTALRAATKSEPWRELERGRITVDECYARISLATGFRTSHLRQAITTATTTLRANMELVSFIRSLKQRYGLRVYAMTNVGHEHSHAALKLVNSWGVFDRVFTSCEAGARKPERAFFDYVLEQSGVDPQHTVFFDDNADHVRIARDLGLRGIVFGDEPTFRTLLSRAFSGSLHSANEFLEEHAGRMYCYKETGELIQDNFSQMMILELTDEPRLVTIEARDGLHYNFYQGAEANSFPDDMDTTSLSLTALNAETKAVQSVMDEMLTYKNEQGILMTYFDRSRPRVDPTVCLNISSLFFTHGRGDEIAASVAFARETLEKRGYIPNGTRYYPVPDAFLFFACRLLYRAPALRKEWAPLLKARLEERVGQPGDGLSLAMRVLACCMAGVPNNADLEALLDEQEEDGSWQGTIFQFPSIPLSIWAVGVATALARKAILLSECPAPEPWAW